MAKELFLWVDFLGPVERPSSEWGSWEGDGGLPTAARVCLHRCGDELVEINDSPVHCMTLNEVYAILSRCSPGPVPIIISRHPDPQVTSAGTSSPLRLPPPGFSFEQDIDKSR